MTFVPGFLATSHFIHPCSTIHFTPSINKSCFHINAGSHIKPLPRHISIEIYTSISFTELYTLKMSLQYFVENILQRYFLKEHQNEQKNMAERKAKKGYRSMQSVFGSSQLNGSNKKLTFFMSLLNCVPCVLKTCSRASVTCVLTCQRTLHAYMLMCRVSRALRAYVPKCTECLRAKYVKMTCALFYSCVNVACEVTCFEFLASHDFRDHVITCQHA